MDKQQKLLHHERVIQLSGLLMMLSPFVNYFLSIYPVQAQNKWTMAGQLALLKGISTTHWILWTASFVVGSMMLKGRRSSWISVIILLGVFVVYDLATFKAQLQRGWLQPTLLLLTNVGVFALVYFQEFRQSSGLASTNPPRSHPMSTVASPQGRVAEQTTVTKITPALEPTSDHAQSSESDFFEVDVSELMGSLVEFENSGPWAEIIEINENLVYLRPISAPPHGIENRPLQIETNFYTLNLHFAEQNDRGYCFICDGIEIRQAQVA